MPGAIDCKGKNYCRERRAPPSAFDRRSFRTIPRGAMGAKVVIGCPRGYWVPHKRGRGGRCSVGTRAQTILRPMGSAKCRRACRRTKRRA